MIKKYTIVTLDHFILRGEAGGSRDFIYEEASGCWQSILDSSQREGRKEILHRHRLSFKKSQY